MSESEEIVVCTIISKNYLSFARTFTDSFLKIHPHGKVFVLLIDTIDDCFDPNKEKFTLIKLDEIGIDDLNSFCFKYNVLEQNTAAKGHFLKFLFEKYGFKKLLYFDPDIMIFNSLENLWELLEKKSIVLTPHLTEPICDDRFPSEYDIMRSGTYNLGFIGLSNTTTARKFLDWWMPHLMEHAFSNVKEGLFTDQKWIDLVPAIFDDVYIIRHPGYNVAYWNLMQRKVELKDRKISVNGKPLYFFHFSGIVPENIECVSKHQNRFTLKNLENIRALYEMYRDLLIENGYLECKKWNFKFDYFENGVKIPSQARKIYAEATKKGIRFDDPFKVSSSKSFFNFVNGPIDDKKPPITRLWFRIYNERDDLKKAFPDVLNNDRKSFINWITTTGIVECELDKKFFPHNFDLRNSSIMETNFFNEKNSSGINVSGYFQGKFGVAESARNLVFALRHAGIPHILNNIAASHHQNTDQTFTKFTNNNPYPINLIVVNADQSKDFVEKKGSPYFAGKYNISFWAWELSSFPQVWNSSFRYFDEIWAPSTFVANAISKSSPIPVVKITCPVELDESKLQSNRKKFNLKNDEFVFLFIFDYLSVFERKNPLAVIKSFKNVFDHNDKAKLVIKSINSSKFPDIHEKLKKSADSKNIVFFDEHMNKDELLSLLASSDCYVSLHRSEGFGLTIAEAMYAGKPVIATNYGGNTDFMNKKNSFPVKYKLVKLEDDYGPYSKGNIWAEPDIDHASNLMKKVFDDYDYAKEIATNGSVYIKKHMNFDVVGQEILSRLNHIQKMFIHS